MCNHTNNMMVGIEEVISINAPPASVASELNGFRFWWAEPFLTSVGQ